MLRVVMAAGAAAWGAAVRDRLEAAGDVRVVGDGVQHSGRLLTLVQALRPAVVLVDQRIVGGAALVPAVRHAHPAARVLVVTGCNDDTLALDVVRRGGHGIIVEDVLASQLTKAIRCLAAGEAWLTRPQEARVLSTLWEMADADRPRAG